MDIIEKLPWYDDYMLILEGKRIAEKGIEDLENPEKQLQRIEKFYLNIGADYLKNQWILQVEENITYLNRGENSRLKQLKREVKFGSAIENAVNNQDDDSIVALSTYKDEELYRRVVKQVMFYIGVSKVKNDPNFIKKAYDAIYRTYPLSTTALFIEEGVYYYIYYFQCVQEFVKRYKSHSQHEDIKQKIKDRCYNAKLMISCYRSDMYMSAEIEQIFAEITKLESLIEDSEIK